jgi:hypothetical protein
MLPTLEELQSKLSCKSISSPSFVHAPQPIPCMMFTPTFPSTESARGDSTQPSSQAFVSSTSIDHMGRRTPLSPTEEVLNWQSKNALA